MHKLRSLLADLAEAGRTGALHLGDAHGGGVIHLVAGRITHAESRACPGIGERLVSSGRLTAEVWRSAYASGRATGTVGRVLVRGGHLGHHELACRVVAAITAATHALLQVPDGAPLHFVPGERHWFGAVARIKLGGLGAETARRLYSRPVPHALRPARRSRSRAATTS